MQRAFKVVSVPLILNLRPLARASSLYRSTFTAVKLDQNGANDQNRTGVNRLAICGTTAVRRSHGTGLGTRTPVSNFKGCRPSR